MLLETVIGKSTSLKRYPQDPFESQFKFERMLGGTVILTVFQCGVNKSTVGEHSPPGRISFGNS